MSAVAAAPRLGAGDVRRIRRLASEGDVALGSRLLRGVTTNESRDEAQLAEWSARAQAFGRELAGAGLVGVGGRDTHGGHDGRDIAVVELTGGLDGPDPVIARYSTRTHAVELFTDSVDFCEQVVDELGWRELFPPGTVRAAAIAHERAHEIIVADGAVDLRRAIGHTLLRIGRFRRYAYVAGADELAAHAYAQASLGLTRSPLLITAAAMAALDALDRPTRQNHREN